MNVGIIWFIYLWSRVKSGLINEFVLNQVVYVCRAWGRRDDEFVKLQCNHRSVIWGQGLCGKWGGGVLKFCCSMVGLSVAVHVQRSCEPEQCEQERWIQLLCTFNMESDGSIESIFPWRKVYYM